MDNLKNYSQYMFVIRQLTSREIKKKYSRSYLGIIWSVLNPLLSMLVLSLIFSQLFKKSIENYPIYYLTGYIIWQTFTVATNASMTTLSDNKALLLKVKFPMEIFIITRVYTSLVNLGYSLAAYTLMLFVFNIRLKISIIIFPAVIIMIVLFSLGISYVLSVAYIFFGDIKHLYSVVLTLWMYCSAIFYPADRLSGIIRIIIENNPIYVYINCLRKAVLIGNFPLSMEWIQMLLWSIGVYLVGNYIFKKNRDRIIQNI